MKILNQQFETVPIDAVRPHPKNPRRGNMDAIAQSVEANGFYGAIIAQKSTGYILAGNHRHQTLAKGGAAEIPVIFVDVDDAQAEKMMLADNKTSELGGYDERALAELLASVGDLEGTGYSSEEFDALMAEITDPAEKPACHGGGEPDNPKDHWKGMPEFKNDKEFPDETVIIMHFKNDADRQAFAEFIGQSVTEKTKYLWFPERAKEAKTTEILSE